MRSFSTFKVCAALALSILGRAESLGVEVPVPQIIVQRDAAVLQSSAGDRTRVTMRPFVLKIDEALPNTQPIAAR